MIRSEMSKPQALGQRPPTPLPRDFAHRVAAVAIYNTPGKTRSRGLAEFAPALAAAAIVLLTLAAWPLFLPAAIAVFAPLRESLTPALGGSILGGTLLVGCFAVLPLIWAVAQAASDASD